MENNEPVIVEPIVEADGGLIIDMASQKIIIGGVDCKHEYQVDEKQDPVTPHLTYASCRKCHHGAILKTGDMFTEKDTIDKDGKIQARKSPLTKAEQTLTKKYQEDVKKAIDSDAGKEKK